MTYKRYTHDIVIKNSEEVLLNAFIENKIGNNKISNIGTIQEKTKIEKSGKRTIAIPGLINLHCHLVHTDQDLKPQALFTWLKELVHKNQNINHMGEVEALTESALKGAKEAISFGTTYLVDNTHNIEASLTAYQRTGLKGLIGLEIFGSDPEKAGVILNEVFVALNKADVILSDSEGSPVRAQDSSITTLTQNDVSLCLSPHACYDVSPELWKLILDYSKENNLKILSHIAESKAEEEWFKNKDSDEAKSAKNFWQSINTLEIKLEHWKKYQSSVDFLKQNSLLDPSLLLTHAVHCREEDLINLKNNSVNLVTCPRSNLFLKNGLADYQLWEKLGLVYGVGTDSKASNQDLDLRKELEKIPLSPRRKFELVTSEPAKILNKENEIGKLEKGMSGDWVVLEIIDKEIDLNTEDIYDLVLDTKRTRVKEVYVNSKLIYAC